MTMIGALMLRPSLHDLANELLESWPCVGDKSISARDWEAVLPDFFTEPEDEAFFAAIGRLTISWAYIEIGLDMLIRVAHHDLGGDKQIRKDTPTGLKRKVEYLRKAFRRLPELAAFADRFAPMADEIIAASDQRHDIVHGFVVQMISGTGTAAMVRIMPSDGKPKPFVVTTVDVMRAAVRASNIQAVAFAAEVLRSLPSK
jgi:hypothetical protein